MENGPPTDLEDATEFGKDILGGEDDLMDEIDKMALG